jgi:hypothetical protein
MGNGAPEAIVDHLLADLSADARNAIGEPSVGGGQRLHDCLHAHLGAVSRAFRATKRGVPIHAAACALPDGRGLLVAGPTRTGKSTLVGLLAVERQAMVVSDDTVWLSGGEVSAIGAPAAIREGSPLWSFARAQWYADDSPRLLVRLADLGPGACRLETPVDLLVFPHFSSSVPGSHAVLSPADAFCRISTSVLRTCTETEIMEIGRLAGRPAISLSYPDARTALALLDHALGLSMPASDDDVEWLESATLKAAGLRPGTRGIRFGPDCALWNHSIGRVVHVKGWTAQTMCDDSLAAQLRPFGLLAQAHGAN